LLLGRLLTQKVKKQRLKVIILTQRVQAQGQKETYPTQKALQQERQEGARTQREIIHLLPGTLLTLRDI